MISRLGPVAVGLVLLAVLGACGPELLSEPEALLLAPGDASGRSLTVLSLSTEESAEGPSAIVELQGEGFRVLQSIVLFPNREMALSALDGIRADLVNRGEAEPGGREVSGAFEHLLGREDATSLFFIESNALARLTVTGPDRDSLLQEFSQLARSKLAGN